MSKDPHEEWRHIVDWLTEKPITKDRDPDSMPQLRWKNMTPGEQMRVTHRKSQAKARDRDPALIHNTSTDELGPLKGPGRFRHPAEGKKPEVETVADKLKAGQTVIPGRAPNKNDDKLNQDERNDKLWGGDPFKDGELKPPQEKGSKQPMGKSKDAPKGDYNPKEENQNSKPVDTPVIPPYKQPEVPKHKPIPPIPKRDPASDKPPVIPPYKKPKKPGVAPPLRRTGLATYGNQVR